MTCEEFESQVDAYIDGGLDAEALRRIERHLDECPACREMTGRLRQVQEQVGTALRQRAAPPQLRAAVSRRLRQRNGTRRWSGLPVGAALAAGLVLGVIGGWRIADRQSAGRSELATGEAVVTAHIRALQPSHLTDVPSSDHHTVKPWFAGKLDFAPPVPELASAGFPLVGGRLDALDGRSVAALVYARGAHLIDVFIWPGAPGRESPVETSNRGFGVMHGSAGAMRYWIVSDVNPVELRQFADAFARALGPGEGGP